MRFASAFVIASLASTSVMAADLSMESVAVPAPEATAYAFSWTGTEFGVFGGGSRTSADFDVLGTSFDGNQSGGRLGVFAGYQYQFSNGMVLGAEGDVSRTWNDKTYTGFGEKVGTDWSGSARARRLRLRSAVGLRNRRLGGNARTCRCSGLCHRTQELQWLYRWRGR